MSKRIKIVGTKARTIRSTTKPAETIDPSVVAKALGAEHVYSIPKHLSRGGLNQLREALFASLRSSGGRPGLDGTDLRPKIPMTPRDWKRLEEISKEIARDGFAPTPGQVGSQILHDAIANLDAQQPSRASESARAVQSSVKAAQQLYLVRAAEKSAA